MRARLQAAGFDIYDDGLEFRPDAFESEAS